MSRLTVTQRLRGTMRRLLREGGRGTAARLARYSQSPHGANILAQNITYFINETEGRPHPIQLDDLDDICAFFRLSIGELTGTSRPGDLTSDEQRIVYAFRALSPAIQDYMIRILEELSLVPRSLQHRPLHLSEELAQNAGSSRSEAPHDRAVPSPDARRLINEAMDLLGQAAATIGADRPLPSARPAEPQTGKVAR